MKTKNMIKIVLSVFIFSCFLTSPAALFAQCPTDINYGKNLVVNGNFSNGYAGWTFTPQTVPWDPGNVGAADGYRIHNAPSLPGDILVGTNPKTEFNNGFQVFGDHTSGSGNFLMVDGVCKLGVKLFSQNVTVTANTNYYFSVWINSLKDNPTNPGVLNFDVGGVSIGANIIAPALGGASVGGGWIQYEVVWFSGAIAGNVAISIQNKNTLDCGNQVDFAIDDIAFIPGCGFGSATPQPNLGPDQSFCGKGGSIILNAGVTPASDLNVTWNDGTGNGVIGLGAAYTHTITAPGTYYVCVTKTGSCAKIDTIVITNTFSINIGGPYNFCSSSSQVLDAGFTGIGVTYKWFKGGVLVPYPNDTKTYTATSAGTYRVDVTVPGCGTQSSTAIITSTAPVTPIDAYYCATSAAVTNLALRATGTNSSNLSWYTVPTGGTALASGLSIVNPTTTQYTIPSIGMGITATQTFYVQDQTISTGTAGPTTFASVNNSGIPNTTSYLQFRPGGDFTINSLQIPFIFYNSFAQFTVTLEVTRADGTSFSPAKTFTSGLSVQTPVNDGTTRLFTLPFTNFDISSSWGSTLGLKLISTSFTFQGQIMIGTNGGAYPYNSSIPGVVTIPNSIIGGATSTTGYAFFYNWNISALTVCARTPVRAISNCPQPVTWTTFYLTPLENACKVTWGTADEKDNKYFAVERSIDGMNFEMIGKVEGGGNRDIASNYYFIDHTPLAGTSYYRITQYDFDGKFSSTHMRPYSSEGLMQVTTYPNPFVQTTTLLVTGEDQQYTYSIYAVNGQLIEFGTGTFNERKIIADGIAKGMYMLTVTSTTDILTTKIVKQ